MIQITFSCLKFGVVQNIWKYFEKICKTWRHFLSFLKSVRENKCLKLSMFWDAIQVTLLLAVIHLLLLPFWAEVVKVQLTLIHSVSKNNKYYSYKLRVVYIIITTSRREIATIDESNTFFIRCHLNISEIWSTYQCSDENSTVLASSDWKTN